MIVWWYIWKDISTLQVLILTIYYDISATKYHTLYIAIYFILNCQDRISFSADTHTYTFTHCILQILFRPQLVTDIIFSCDEFQGIVMKTRLRSKVFSLEKTLSELSYINYTHRIK